MKIRGTTQLFNLPVQPNNVSIPESGMDGQDGFSIVGPQGPTGPQGPAGTGSGNTGGMVVIDDNYQELPIVVPPGPTNGTITVTTTGNIDDLDFGNVAVILMNNATLSTIRGLKAGAPGQKIRIISIGAGQVNFAHQDANSSTSNRLVNAITSGITPIAAGVGSAEYQYDDVNNRWRLISHYQGAWISIPYSSGDYTASGSLTWTVDSGDLITFAFYISGNLIQITGYWDTTTLSGTASNQLFVLIPNSWTAKKTMQGLALAIQGGTTGVTTYNRVQSSNNTKMEIGRGDLGNFTLSANNNYIRWNMPFELN